MKMNHISPRLAIVADAVDDLEQEIEPPEALAIIFSILHRLRINSCAAAPLEPELAEDSRQFEARALDHYHGRQSITHALLADRAEVGDE